MPNTLLQRSWNDIAPRWGLSVETPFDVKVAGQVISVLHRPAAERRPARWAGEQEMSYETEIRAFWQRYLGTLSDDHPHRGQETPEGWHLGDGSEMADALGRLVQIGRKTATCCRYLGENLVEEVGLSLLTDGSGRPLCVLEAAELTVRRFCDVDEQFAWDEGEGDRSLSHWRKAHWNFFAREAAVEGYRLSEDMLLQCERYRVLYREQHPGTEVEGVDVVDV